MTHNIHKSSDRGTFTNEWLTTKYSFNFSHYYNPERMGFGDLKVLNDDIIAPKEGFGKHPHQNMEIITLVMKGSLKHQDSMGNEGIIKAGEVQVMSAGKGVVHSEFNNSKDEQVELLQIWIDTAQEGIKPHYNQKNMAWTRDFPKVLVSGEKTPSSLFINQEARIIAGKLKEKEEYHHELKEHKGLFIMNIKGRININDNSLEERDSIEIAHTEEVKVIAEKESIILVIEVKV